MQVYKLLLKGGIPLTVIRSPDWSGVTATISLILIYRILHIAVQGLPPSLEKSSYSFDFSFIIKAGSKERCAERTLIWKIKVNFHFLTTYLYSLQISEYGLDMNDSKTF